MLLLAVALHGICYDFFFVTGFMYTDRAAKIDSRPAQGLLVFLTQGIGMFFGFRIMAGGNLFGVIPLNLTVGEYGKQVASSTEYVAALKEARGDTAALDFFSTFTQMFSRSLPSELDPGILATTMGEWKNFWLLPAIMAAAILIVFAVGFWDKRKQDEGEATDIA